MPYCYALPTEGGFIGLVCCDPACEHALHESGEPQPTAEAAEAVAEAEWAEAVGLVQESECTR